MSLISIFLLGILNREELNAYEIVKLLERYKISEWMYIPESTIYATLKKINQKGLTDIIEVRDGNMPEKKIHVITESGKKTFLKELKKILREFSYDFNRFSVGLFFVDSLEEDDIKKCFNERLDLLQKYINGINNRICYLEQLSVPEKSIETVRRNKYFIETEREFIENYMKKYLFGGCNDD